MKQLKQFIMSTLGLDKKLVEAELIADIASYVTELIKSEIRRSHRCEFANYQLKAAINKEFGIDLSDKHLLMVIKQVRNALYSAKVGLLHDGLGVIANRPLSFS